MKNQNNNYSYCFRAEEYVHTQSKYNLQFIFLFFFCWKNYFLQTARIYLLMPSLFATTLYI